MAKLSITQAWNETAAFLKREAGLVVPIAILLLALPGAALQLAMPTDEPGQMPQISVWFFVLIPVVFVASLIGSIAIAYLALRPGASVAEALQHALRRFPVLLAANLLIALAISLVALPVLYMAGLGDLVAGTADPEAVAGRLVLGFLLLFLIFIFFWIRLMLVTPAGTIEPIGPITAIRRSWELTAGHFWKLLGFVLLVGIAALVVLLVVSTFFGLLIVALAGPPEPGSTTMVVTGIVSALLQALVSALFVVLIARIYAQLTGGTPEEVFA